MHTTTVRVRGRNFRVSDRPIHVVFCDAPDCEWYSAAAIDQSHAVEIERNHLRVTHRDRVVDHIWDHSALGGIVSSRELNERAVEEGGDR